MNIELAIETWLFVSSVVAMRFECVCVCTSSLNSEYVRMLVCLLTKREIA